MRLIRLGTMGRPRLRRRVHGRHCPLDRPIQREPHPVHLAQNRRRHPRPTRPILHGRRPQRVNLTGHEIPLPLSDGNSEGFKNQVRAPRLPHGRPRSAHTHRLGRLDARETTMVAGTDGARSSTVGRLGLDRFWCHRPRWLALVLPRIHVPYPHRPKARRR